MDEPHKVTDSTISCREGNNIKIAITRLKDKDTDDSSRCSRLGHDCYSVSPLMSEINQDAIDDFIVDGKRKLGMMFLIQWVDNAFFYQICYVSINLTSAILNPHLESKRVFVCKNS